VKYRKKATILLAAFIILSFVCMAIANGIQTDGGKVAIEDGSIETDLGTLTYKLYKSETASEQQPAPGLLLLHGYQNDHETSGAYAIEMARRGAVVLALMYVMLLLCEAAFDLDYRFVWPFFKSFTGERVLQFLVYLPIFALFFLLNNSKIFAQMRTPAANKPGFGGFMSCWWRNALCMAKRTRNILTITKRLWILQLYWIYAMLMLKLILRRIICTCPDTLRE
jgi:hypothetical protein